MLEKTIIAYNEAVFDTDRERALAIIHDALARGVTPEEVVFHIIIPALEQMVKGISESFDTNLAQHFMASQIAAQVTEEMIARFKTAPVAAGTVVIGNSHGDLHSLGKRIVVGCLRSLMFEVVDLGVSVSAESFVDEAVRHGAQVIGISSMMIHTAKGEAGSLAVRRLLQERGLEHRIKLIVGGAPFRFAPGLFRLVGADACAPDGVTAGKVIAGLIQEVA